MAILSYSAITQTPIVREKRSISNIKESYLSRTRKYISENKELAYKTEEKNMRALKECTNAQDYFHKFKCMVDTFDRKIYSFTNQMNLIQDSFVSRLSKYSPINIVELSKSFTEEDEFFYDRYDYTNLNNTLIPSSDTVFDFAECYEKVKNILLSASTLTDKQKYEKLMSLVDDLRINFSDKHYQRFRGDIAGLDKLIYATDFSEELFNIYRGNGNIQSNSLIDLHYLKNINKDVLNSKTFTDQMNTIKNNIVALYTSIIKKMEPIFDVIYTGTISSGVMGTGQYYLEDSVIMALCTILNIISSNVSKLMDIHMIAYTSKLDAIIDYFDQSSRILNIAWHKATSKNQWYSVNESSIDPFYNEFAETQGIEESITRIFDDGVFLLNSILESHINKIRIEQVVLSEFGLNKAKKGFAAIKEFIAGIIKKISEVIGRFTEKAMKFISSDKGYLEHYKDIILQHNLADTDISDYYDYNFLELTKIQVPDLNYAAMKDSLENDETFIKAKFSGYIKDKNASLKDNIIATIRGEAINIQSTAAEDGKKINRTDLYNYVIGYNDIHKSIQDDFKSFQDAQKAAEAEIKRLENSIKSHESMGEAIANKAEKMESQSGSSTPPPANNSSTTTKVESTINDPMSEYFNEMEINKTANNGTATATSSANNPATHNTNIEGNKSASDISNKAQEDMNAASANKEMIEDQEESIKLANATKTYFSVCSEVLSAKLALSEGAYKQSMDIIRWHVQNFNNIKGKSEVNKNAQSTGTNYEEGKRGEPSKEQKKAGIRDRIANFFK